MFLHGSIKQRNDPPVEYVKHMKAMFGSKERGGSDGVWWPDANCTELDSSLNTEGYEDMIRERFYFSKVSDGDESGRDRIKEDPVNGELIASPHPPCGDPDGLILAGHAIAGYLRTSSLSELEWDVLFASVCARYVIDLVNLQWCLRESSDKTEYIYQEWNNKRALKRLMTLGKERVYAIWDDISKTYD